MNVKDSQLISYINRHYKELLDELKDINSFERFSCEENAVLRKAVKMDLFQIGENFGKLSTEIKSNLNNRDIRGVIDVRNYIAHGYAEIDDLSIWHTIKEDLPRLISSLNILK